VRSDDYLGLVTVELDLGDPDRLGEILVGQGRVDDLVTMTGEERPV